MPPDFPAVAPTMRHDDLMARYHAGRAVIRRWLDECGFRRRFDPEPPPDGFAEIAPLHTQAELRRMYGRSGWTINRWAHIAQVKLKRIRPEYVRRDPKVEIDMCLNCERLRCNGHCGKIKGL